MNSFMQNKPNFLRNRANVSSCFTMNYEQITMSNEPKNKAKQTQPVVSEPVLSVVERVEPFVVSLSNLIIHRRLSRYQFMAFCRSCLNWIFGLKPIVFLAREMSARECFTSPGR